MKGWISGLGNIDGIALVGRGSNAGRAIQIAKTIRKSNSLCHQCRSRYNVFQQRNEGTRQRQFLEPMQMEM